MKQTTSMGVGLVGLLLSSMLCSCASINIGGGVVMKRSRFGDETPVTDLRTMHSASEIRNKEELLNAIQKNQTIKVTGEMPGEGLVSPHR